MPEFFEQSPLSRAIRYCYTEAPGAFFSKDYQPIQPLWDSILRRVEKY
jgi:hypothetical protein